MSVEVGPTVDGQPVAAAVEDLQEQVRELASELAEERQRRREAEQERDELRERVDALEDQPDVDVRDTDDDQGPLAQIWIDDLPVGPKLDTVSELVWEHDDRISDIERGEIDPGEVVAEAGKGPDPSDLLPVHQMYNTVTTLEPSEHGVSARKELAARVFPYFDEYAYKNEGRLVLPSTKIGDIIERELPTRELQDRLDVVDPHNETTKQVMRWIAEYGGEIFRFDTDRKQNRLIADRDAWIEYSTDVTDAAFSDGGGE